VTTTLNRQPEAAGKQVLRTEKLVKIYGGRAVVNGVDINCRSGEIVGLLGPNGAGKTTSFYMVVGLVRPNSGRVFFEDKEVTDFPMYKRARMGMGYLPQEESIFRKMTVEQNIMAILETQPLNRKERKHRCEELLTQFGIDHVGKQLALTLSGGEKRRLTIARSLVTKPSLLMLDEPFSGVDPIAVYDVQQIIKNLGDLGLGILITDHNVRETLNIVDRAYLISEGKVVTQGDKDFLLTDPIARKVYLGETFQM
jgi:lipopolysaccharide export system ATP-binding protein